MVERGNLLLPLHGIFFLISSKRSFICTMTIYTTTFVKPVVVHWLKLEIVCWVHHGKSILTNHHMMNEPSTTKLNLNSVFKVCNTAQFEQIHWNLFFVTFFKTQFPSHLFSNMQRKCLQTIWHTSSIFNE